MGCSFVYLHQGVLINLFIRYSMYSIHIFYSFCLGTLLFLCLCWFMHVKMYVCMCVLEKFWKVMHSSVFIIALSSIVKKLRHMPLEISQRVLLIVEGLLCLLAYLSLFLKYERIPCSLVHPRTKFITTAIRMSLCNRLICVAVYL